MYLQQTNWTETYGVCPVIPEDIAPPHQMCNKIKIVSNIADAERVAIRLHSRVGDFFWRLVAKSDLTEVELFSCYVTIPGRGLTDNLSTLQLNITKKCHQTKVRNWLDPLISNVWLSVEKSQNLRPPYPPKVMWTDFLFKQRGKISL